MVPGEVFYSDTRVFGAVLFSDTKVFCAVLFFWHKGIWRGALFWHKGIWRGAFNYTKVPEAVFHTDTRVPYGVFPSDTGVSVIPNVHRFLDAATIRKVTSKWNEGYDDLAVWATISFSPSTVIHLIYVSFLSSHPEECQKSFTAIHNKNDLLMSNVSHFWVKWPSNDWNGARRRWMSVEQWKWH